MADTGQTGQRLTSQPVLQVSQLAFGPSALKVSVLDRRDTSRIITAIFEPLQRIEQMPGNRFPSENSDNPAHDVQIPRLYGALTPFDVRARIRPVAEITMRFDL
jgi:hypothetical protein